MRHFNPEDVPCRFCQAGAKEVCRTRTGRKYRQAHIKRKELAQYASDSTIIRLITG